ncbi:MAG: hemin uptake protein HemP [Thiotrichaceae bacterium]|uniref:Uncharacterized protein n=1 Tax=Candidatus Thiocaldithrix dubininis TaxID=3080823 RepID=A0AA95H1D3_9GAMM|nr:MAG: hypothetical protein QJT80_07910 [Candidatus Thiocaldithrix dubininis]
MKAKAAEPAELPCINLDDWMQGFKKIMLKHGTRPYFLTITRKGNLILTAAADVPNPQSDKD